LRPIELGSGVVIESFPVLCGSLLFQRTAGSGYFKKIQNLKNWLVFWYLKHSRIKEPSVLGISKTLGDLLVFVKEFFDKEIGKILEIFISLVKNLTIFSFWLSFAKISV